MPESEWTTDPDATRVHTGLPVADPRFLFLTPPSPAHPADFGQLGPYRVVKLLGEGGMGYVFLAHDDALRRAVALKVMKPDEAARPTAKDRFLREGRAAAALKSDHVTTIYAVGEANGVPFLAMEFLDGKVLDQWLKARGGTAPVNTVLAVARHALKGLAAAHEKGLVHRDIKPSNLWVEKSTGRVKVLDFGLARGPEGDHLTASGAILGTAAYMAPEQAGGKPVDARADLFSLGVVLYQMLAGKSPFDEGAYLASLIAVGTKDPPPLDAAVAGVPPDFAAFVARLMSKDPAGRPWDAKAALGELAAIEQRRKGVPVGGTVPPDPSTSRPMMVMEVVTLPPAPDTESTLVLPDGPPSRVTKRPPAVSRRRMAWAAGAVGVLLLVVAGVVALTRTGPRAGATTAGAGEAAPAEYVSKATGMKFVRVPAGRFMMGSPKAEGGRFENEELHEVELTKPYYLGVHEVTRGQFRTFAEAANYRTEPERAGSGDVWRNTSRFAQTDDHPAVSVTWNDAAAFCEWLSLRDNRTYRLPTEAEWEYAARAGTTTPYSFGDRAGGADMNCDGNYPYPMYDPKGPFLKRTSPAGSYRANAFGLHDMHGNAAEWCRDYYGPYGADRRDPVRLTNDGTIAYRIQRGGGWFTNARNCRSADRSWLPQDFHRDTVGFRVCAPIN